MSDFFPDIFTPTITIRLPSTSEDECTASLIMAPERPIAPAINLNVARKMLIMMLTVETRVAVDSNAVSFTVIFMLTSEIIKSAGSR